MGGLLTKISCFLRNKDSEEPVFATASGTYPRSCG